MELSMKKYITVITEDDIRFGIEEAATELEETEQLRFPDADARAEFLDDCVACVIDRLDQYEGYRPNWTTEVLDAACLYGYEL